MKKSVLNLMRVVFAASAVVMMSACHNKDMYDEDAIVARDIAKQEAKMNDVKTEYAKNFKARYGEVAADQCWDFSKGGKLAKRATTRGYSNMMIEQEDGLDFNPDGHTIYSNKAVYNALDQVLPDNTVHEGKTVTLVAPSSGFYIFPVSTRCGDTHDFMVKVGNSRPINVYHKDWKEFDIHYVNKQDCGDKFTDMPGLYIQAPVGTPVEIYLANVGGDPSKNYGTNNGRAIFVDMPEGVELQLPQSIHVSEDHEIKYMGIEDGTDNDFNDVVVAIVGDPEIPEQVIITEDEYTIETSYSKRYMIEDMGAADDFDFNDVVVDVYMTRTNTYKRTYENGYITNDVKVRTEEKAEAVVRALGGTFDVTLYIGNTLWSKSGAGFDTSTMYNTFAGNIDYDAELAKFEVEGWDPDRNNISAAVNGFGSLGVYEIRFPLVGEIPMVIAFDTDQKWMNERENIPNSWFIKY